MTEYERFQQIMAKLNTVLKEKNVSTASIPPGFEELFGKFKK